ncbi:unnamed protein product [Arabidopsis halleri]
MDRDSPLWNKDMQCTGFNQAVKKAYLDQYSIDTKNLLDARAEELVSGGLMLLLGSCLRDGVKMSETPKGIVMDFIGESLSDLAQKGEIEQDKVDSFKTSFYFAEQSEIRQIIEENGTFTIKAFEDIIHSKNDFPLDPKILAFSFKAFSGAFISTHFGTETNAKPGMQYLIQVPHSKEGTVWTSVGIRNYPVLTRSCSGYDHHFECRSCEEPVDVVVDIDSPAVRWFQNRHGIPKTP